MIFHIFSVPFLPWVFRRRLFKVLRKKNEIHCTRSAPRPLVPSPFNKGALKKNLHQQPQKKKGGRKRQWDVCKSPGFPSNRVAAGQVDPSAVRITMVCSLFACRLSASDAFLLLSGAVC